MWKVILGIALAAALVLPGVAVAQNGRPDVICATCGDSGTGWTGCTQVSASDSGGVPYIAHFKHYLVVNYCKRNGTITSLSIAAHGCDSQGAVGCDTGPAWVTSGGTGYGWASLEGRATYTGTLAGSPFASTSVVHIDIPIG